MFADLLHGLRSRKLWFPCKYFTINAAFLSVIAVAMKLPVDLSGSMPGVVDQVAKLGSMAFMCTMMANLFPCLATMDNNELLTNITALGVLVITLVVNVCIQIQTGVVEGGNTGGSDVSRISSVLLPRGYDLRVLAKISSSTIATIYVTFLLFLLIIHVCSSLAILKSKRIIELKYQKVHETASKDVREGCQDPGQSDLPIMIASQGTSRPTRNTGEPQEGNSQSTRKLLTVEKLQQLVSNYWIMAGSGSPQFIMACSATTTASGVICALTTILHAFTVSWSISSLLEMDYGSAYKWSTLLILIVQFVGIVLGTIAPLSRCFATLSFKVSIQSIRNHIKVFKVEKYWTHKLYDWKYGIIPFPFHSCKRELKVIIKYLKGLILMFSIKIQEGVVVLCKIIALIPFCLMICVLYSLRFLKWSLQAIFRSREKKTQNLEQRKYVLQLEDENELADRTLEGLLKTFNRLIQKSEKKQPKSLMTLILENSTEGFQGVKIFHRDGPHVQRSLSKVEYRDCWSLPVVTLTTIAVTLPNIDKVKVKSLLKSVREGLQYVTLVEETLNATDDHYKSIQKASKVLWEEVDFRHKWLGIKLKDIVCQVNKTAYQVDTTPQNVQLFFEKAKNMINEGVGSTDIEGPDGYSEHISICAYSMFRITETIIDDTESHKKLFDELSSRIADIMAACLTNLPHVIAKKCHTSVIEKREASVQVATKLLGETKHIVNTLQGPLQDKWHAYLSMNPEDLAFIDKWRAYSSEP
ncbi:hypothetical protein HanRHA438_Chr12g0534821 [Helianthus annuus]|uniref:uncharacterized protein LOC110917250 isoform X1 n=2 Tax=Helianthus annuus TaxID=4232 RepID=UPI000B9025D4|nr:uncharacterized protein LOC110917250 isoform X1 [Helianthus annuus]KAJ0864900.1 hypothetical protein HanRHA438_Chr12g0534821 [Helianthus annuus]